MQTATDISRPRHADRDGFAEIPAGPARLHAMELVGRLSGGLAHNFNNLLFVIMGYADLLLSRLSPDDPAGRELAEIRGAARRAALLTDELMAFSRKQVLRPAEVDLNGLIEEMSPALRELVGPGVDLRTALAPGLGRVRVDPERMGRSIEALAAHAREAMPASGRLLVETANVDLDAAVVRQQVPVRQGAYVMLAASDTGPGMDEETRARVFEPFFPANGGTPGLGLAAVYGFVKQSGGYIWAYSRLGRGTTFRIYLPRILDGGKL